MWQSGYGSGPSYIHIWECKKCGFKIKRLSTKREEPTPHTAQTCRGNQQNFGKHELKHSVRKG